MKFASRMGVQMKINLLHLLLYAFVVTSSPIDKSPTGKFWQITDIHWDQQYSIDGDTNHMCHKKYALTSHHNSELGDYACDSPWPLVKSAINTMVKINDAPDFILWTGDNVPHTDDPEPDFSVIFSTLSNITVELRTAFPTTVPLLPVLGNHDAYPKDFYPVVDHSGDTFYGQYLTKGSWSILLPESAQEDFKIGGYYAYKISSDLTILVLNTNLYYSFNKLGIGAPDPCGQFAWLRNRLGQARDTHSKVIIAAHAPPGYFERFTAIPFFNATYNAVYVDIVSDFGDVIMAQIYGHEHTDSFRLFSSSKGRGSVGFLAPSITPWFPSPVFGGTAINPSLRLYLYNPSTILDYSQYHLNLNKLNSTLNTEIKPIKTNSNTNIAPWELYYEARDTYGLDALDFNNMLKLYKSIEEHDAKFQSYYRRNSAGYDDGFCDSACKKMQLCAIKNLHIEDMKLCLKSGKQKIKKDNDSGKESVLSSSIVIKEDENSVELSNKNSVNSDDSVKGSVLSSTIVIKEDVNSGEGSISSVEEGSDKNSVKKESYKNSVDNSVKGSVLSSTVVIKEDTNSVSSVHIPENSVENSFSSVYLPSIIIDENINPLEEGHIHLPSTRHSTLIIGIVVISMTLMMVLAVSVAIMLMLLIIRNHRELNPNVHACHFNWPRQKYNQLA